MVSVLRACVLFAMAVLVSACSVRNPVSTNASDSEVASVRYEAAGPKRVTLFTIISNERNSGEHTGLLINGSEQVLFDPAGSFRTDGIVAKNDVVYGMSPYMVDQYMRFHARETFHVVVQTLDVDRAHAELALRRAQSIGPVLEAQCALTTADVLSQIPGFEDVPRGYSPLKLRDYFATKGATFDRLFEQDEGDKSNALANFSPEPGRVQTN